jgi:hypothetical protein
MSFARRALGLVRFVFPTLFCPLIRSQQREGRFRSAEKQKST